MRLRPALFAVLLPAVMFSACNPGGPTYITSESPNVAQLNVSATGTIDVAPDRAIVGAGVVSQGKTAREAMMGNATLMTAVFDELETAGIAKANIATSQLSLNPQYDYSDRRAPKIARYEARNTVTVKSDDLDQVGPLLDALVRAGVNQIDSVQFTVADPSAARDSARSEAIATARSKAKNMADAAGVSLGTLLSLSERGEGSVRPMPMMAMRAESGFSPNTPVSAGDQTLSVTVDLTYAIVE